MSPRAPHLPRICYNVKRMSDETRPICHVVAGPNGSGKSTFALADSTLVFYAVPAIQRLIYRRNGDSLVLDPALAEPMRKELGI